jgi:very-short-patch-repair endonuclease
MDAHWRARWNIVSRTDLRASGLSKDAIRRRVRSRLLREVFPGAYAIGGADLGWRSFAYAALLCVGPDEAALASWTGIAWHGLLDPRPGPPHVITTRRTGHTPEGIQVHRVRSLAADQVVIVDGLPVTSVERTLLDLAAAKAPEPVLQRAMNEAEFRRVLDLEALEALAATSRHGVRALRRAMERRAPTVSELEDQLFAALREAQLPPPVANWSFGPYKLDFFWPDHGVVVETDGWGAHGEAGGRTRDRRKDAYLRGRGLVVLHVPQRRFATRQMAVIAEIAAALGAP